jgi:hypothetical protein
MTAILASDGRSRAAVFDLGDTSRPMGPLGSRLIHMPFAVDSSRVGRAFTDEPYEDGMRFANVVSVVIGLFGLGVIAAVLFIILPGMGGGGFLWFLVAAILLVFAGLNVIPAVGVVLPWLLRRVAPRQRLVVFAVWLACALPIVAFDVGLLVKRETPTELARLEVR